MAEPASEMRPQSAPGFRVAAIAAFGAYSHIVVSAQADNFPLVQFMRGEARGYVQHFAFALVAPEEDGWVDPVRLIESCKEGGTLSFTRFHVCGDLLRPSSLDALRRIQARISSELAPTSASSASLVCGLGGTDLYLLMRGEGTLALHEQVHLLRHLRIQVGEHPHRRVFVDTNTTMCWVSPGKQASAAPEPGVESAPAGEDDAWGAISCSVSPGAASRLVSEFDAVCKAFSAHSQGEDADEHCSRKFEIWSLNGKYDVKLGYRYTRGDPGQRVYSFYKCFLEATRKLAAEGLQVFNVRFEHEVRELPVESLSPELAMVGELPLDCEGLGGVHAADLRSPAGAPLEELSWSEDFEEMFSDVIRERNMGTLLLISICNMLSRYRGLLRHPVARDSVRSHGRFFQGLYTLLCEYMLQVQSNGDLGKGDLRHFGWVSKCARSGVKKNSLFRLSPRAREAFVSAMVAYASEAFQTVETLEDLSRFGVDRYVLSVNGMSKFVDACYGLQFATWERAHILLGWDSPADGRFPFFPLNILTAESRTRCKVFGAGFVVYRVGAMSALHFASSVEIVRQTGRAVLLQMLSAPAHGSENEKRTRLEKALRQRIVDTLAGLLREALGARAARPTLERLAYGAVQHWLQSITKRESSCMWALWGAPDPRFGAFNEFLLSRENLEKMAQESVNTRVGAAERVRHATAQVTQELRLLRHNGPEIFYDLFLARVLGLEFRHVMFMKTYEYARTEPTQRGLENIIVLQMVVAAMLASPRTVPVGHDGPVIDAVSGGREIFVHAEVAFEQLAAKEGWSETVRQQKFRNVLNKVDRLVKAWHGPLVRLGEMVSAQDHKLEQQECNGLFSMIRASVDGASERLLERIREEGDARRKATARAEDCGGQSNPGGATGGFGVSLHGYHDRLQRHWVLGERGFQMELDAMLRCYDYYVNHEKWKSWPPEEWRGFTTDRDRLNPYADWNEHPYDAWGRDVADVGGQAHG